MDPRTTPLTCKVVLTINGADYALQVDTRMTLLDALRDQLNLYGAKKGCDHGQCGACTIHIDGERHLGCLTLTVAVQGQRITTIEGLADGDQLHPMQQALSITMRSNAAIVLRGKSCRRSLALLKTMPALTATSANT